MADLPSSVPFSGPSNQGFQLGNNFGDIRVHMSSQHAASPESPATPTSNIPFRRDPDFIPRGDLADQIYKKCVAFSAQVALIGLGGVGRVEFNPVDMPATDCCSSKSQLTIELCHRVRARDPNTWVFWVHASNAARFEMGYRNIADMLKLRGRHDPQADILQLVHRWMSDERRGRWLMIPDSADSCELVTHKATGVSNPAGSTNRDGERFLLPFIPQSPAGSVLVTTQNEDVAVLLTENYRDIIRVEPMAKSDALLLLSNRFGDNVAAVEGSKLVKVLDHMPLAITQAAAYIGRRAPRMSVARYLNEISRLEGSSVNLLSHDSGDRRRDFSASNSIVITWHMTFKHIQSTRKSAAKLLSLMSLFDCHDIPGYLLNLCLGGGDGIAGYSKHWIAKFKDQQNPFNASSFEIVDIKKWSDFNQDLEEDINVLRGYSLITATGGDKSFTMHHLVQLSTRDWLQSQGQLEAWKQVFTVLICEAFPKNIPNLQDLSTCQLLLPHAEAVADLRPKDDKWLLLWSNVLRAAGLYATGKSQYAKAEILLRKSFIAARLAVGNAHLMTLQAAHAVIDVLKVQQKYQQAETLGRQTLLWSDHEAMTDEDESMLLFTLINLIPILGHLGKLQEAEEFGRRAMKMEEQGRAIAAGPTSSALTSLADLLIDQSRYGEAEKLVRRALATAQEKEATVFRMLKLARILQVQNKYSEAERLNRQALAMTESTGDGPLSMKYASINELARLLTCLERFREAEPLYREWCTRTEKFLGSEDPATHRIWRACVDLVIDNIGLDNVQDKVFWERIHQKLANLESSTLE